jgi:hypothetical protein
MLWPHTIFDGRDRDAVLARLAALRSDAARVWGKMDAAQAMAHCSLVLECTLGERPVHQVFIGKLIGRFFRAKLLGPEPFSRNAPTGSFLIVADPRNFARERDRLTGAIRRFAAAGPASAATFPHGFLGRLTGDEWGRMMHKHVDHHLRQFGA